MPIIKLTKREADMIVAAITEVKEYTTEWDNLAGKIIKQAKLKNLM